MELINLTVCRQLFFFPPLERWQLVSRRWWRHVPQQRWHVSHGALPRPIIGSVGMRLSDASRGLSRSGLRRECGLVAGHLVHVVVVTDHYRALVFGRLQNDGTRSFYFETTSKPGEIFIALHLGSYQDVFYYKKTRPCLFCSCPATCEVAFFTSTFLRNYFLSQEMMCALNNCYQVQRR